MKSFGKYLSAVLICAMSLGFLSCCSKNATKNIDEIVQRNGMPIIFITSELGKDGTGKQSIQAEKCLAGS